MTQLVVDVIPWYVAIQLCAAAALPLSVRFFADLPDRGYAFAKALGVFLVGVTLWLGTSYGLLRNEFGGALIALGAVTAVSYGFGGYRALHQAWTESGSAAGRRRLWYVVSVEALFVVAFGVWAYVRAHDPAANHTEQPMDLMFMNSIWTSPTYPPRDAWLAGYPISYYYLGYWLLTTLGHLSSTPPALAYNVGQASWYGLLLVSSFGLGANLYAILPLQRSATGPDTDGEAKPAFGASLIAGLLTAMFVGVIGNLQVILEALYGRGASLSRLIAWLDVNGFPENAQQSGTWRLGHDWWWWRSSRVLADQDLLGNHIEVIDEFPMFSYLLGDNHPHVLTMPVVILVIGMALAIYVRALRTGAMQREQADESRVAAAWRGVVASLPLGYGGLAFVAIVSGGLVFLNTWDYPPYWLLLIAGLFAGMRSSAMRRTSREGGETGRTAFATALFGLVLALATLVVYLPYFLTAQSQAGGFVPNLFNPSRWQQVMLMFGVFVPAIAGLLVWGWTRARPSVRTLLMSGLLVFGAPMAFLTVSALLATGTARGRELLSRMVLPEGASSYLPFILERWLSRPYTFILFGVALAVCAAILWAAISREAGTGRAKPGIFVLLVTGLALLLVYMPEFVYLRDNFGTRMNTVFKFYYQAWLLLGVAAAYVVANAVFTRGNGVPAMVRGLAALTLLISVGSLLFPVAGAYSKTQGFSSEEPTLDATRYVLAENPTEYAAAEWVRANTNVDDVVVQAKGASYWASNSRISAMTGRATLLGWEGHERQWRGEAYSEMANGRAEVLDQIYRTAGPGEIAAMLAAWDIDYVYVGPVERNQFGISPASEERLMEAMDLVFDGDSVRIYRRR